VPVRVNMPIAGSTVTLQVIQEDLESPQECTPSGGPAPAPILVTVPKRVAGAHTIQVTGRSGNTQVQHSEYVVLGMQATNTGNPYPSNDFFFSFETDPVLKVTSDVGSETVEERLSAVQANSNSGNDSRLCSTPTGVSWYKLDTATGQWNAAPAPGGASVAIGTRGQSTFVRITGTYSQAAGDVGIYALDLLMQAADSPGSACSSGVNKSSRLYVKVVNGLNPSVDEWVYALCYARFKLTDLSSANSVTGQAVSGCKRPEEVIQGMTGRLLPW
jgi:hypothetical protein